MSASARVAKLVRQVERMDGRSPRPVDMPKLGRTLTESEEDFFLRALDRGDVDVLRHGWPDFLLRNRATGKLYGVEVKGGPTERLRQSQRHMFEALERVGIPVYVWTPRDRAKLTPWRKFQGDPRGTRV